ncbi:SNARE associated Golgi protein-like protein [Thalassoporum mexicanum PCC 7367]|uniref:TVP38/TMEM64 family protein n=1 Tax=Thalassoporum mexicanum TaxID=3457544 RepID=UPI00029FA497|nr:TVP38/TMEM64 family protein [Pseudanabaena sp. PCC 7367]AFY68452.1 SNARE associated Golgi protein-like protein [Pseudanabaena sp. PCC 7367]
MLRSNQVIKKTNYADRFGLSRKRSPFRFKALKFSDPSILVALLVLGLGIALMFDAAPAMAQEAAESSGFNVRGSFIDALQWIKDQGATGGIVFMLLYIVATVAFLPGSILTLGAGVVFGVVLGSVYVFIGATIGATAAFLVGRYVARGWVAKKIEGNKKFKAIDEAVGREGLKIVLLTRLSPVFPFNLLNYAYGLTGVSLKDYVIGSVGMIPGTIMYVYLGSLVRNLAAIGTESQASDPRVTWAIRIIGFIATVAVTVVVTRVARKALSESVDGDLDAPNAEDEKNSVDSIEEIG